MYKDCSKSSFTNFLTFATKYKDANSAGVVRTVSSSEFQTSDYVGYLNCIPLTYKGCPKSPRPNYYKTSIHITIK